MRWPRCPRRILLWPPQTRRRIRVATSTMWLPMVRPAVVHAHTQQPRAKPRHGLIPPRVLCAASTGAITVAQHAEGDFALGRVHKNIATTLLEMSQDDGTSDEDLVLVRRKGWGRPSNATQRMDVPCGMAPRRRHPSAPSHLPSLSPPP